jgi:hypothetical protein
MREVIERGVFLSTRPLSQESGTRAAAPSTVPGEMFRSQQAVICRKMLWRLDAFLYKWLEVFVGLIANAPPSH